MDLKGLFITGTDTGVGKTLVTTCLLSAFRQHGLDAGVMKPIETGVEDPATPGEDARILIAAAQVDDDPADVSPLRLKPAASPYQAGQMERRPIQIEPILSSYRTLCDRHRYMLVEGIGGLQVPITARYRVLDLARDMGLPLVVVARYSLGTLNHTLLTLKAAQDEGLSIFGIVLNHAVPRPLNSVEKGCAEIIEELAGVPVVGQCPFIDPASPRPRMEVLEAIGQSFDLGLEPR